MSVLTPILKLGLSCVQTASWVIECLARANLSMTQTFNMQWLPSGDGSQVEDVDQEADVGHRVIIFLVRQGNASATLLLYGEEGYTWVSISKPSATPGNTNLAVLIQSVLQSEVEVQSSGQ